MLGCDPALREIVCRLLCEYQPELIAYGADRPTPSASSPSATPAATNSDAIVDAELRRVLSDPDPLHGIAQLVARWGAAFGSTPTA